MRVPLAAVLICLGGAASAATCDKATPASTPPASRAPGGWVLQPMAWQAPAPTATGATPPREPRHDERGLLLAGIALMAGIVLRRTGGPR